MNTYARVAADPSDWFSPDEVKKAKDYKRPLTRARLLSSGLDTVFLFVILGTGAAPWLVDRMDGVAWPLQLMAVIGSLLVISGLLTMPISIWVTFRHEKDWGFSTETPKGYAMDAVKGLGVSLVMAGVLMVPLWAVIRGLPDLWWLVGWGIFLAFSIVLGALFPVVIMPIFNSFTPLEDEELAERIRTMVASVGKKASDVLVMDESKRSTKDNAFFAGLGATRRVVLADNILAYPHPEIESVVAHELGHWRLRHLMKGLATGVVTSFGMFAVLRAVSTWQPALDLAGVDSFANPGAFPLLILTFTVISMGLRYFNAWESRAHERQADLHALEVTKDVECFQEMMRRLHTKNLADLAPSTLDYLKMSHPPAAERLQLAADWASAN